MQMDRAAVLAAGFLAVVLLGSMGGTAQAVASRTSDGLGLATPGPQPSAFVISGVTVLRSDGRAGDRLVLPLGLVAALGFGGGLWLLLGRPSRRWTPGAPRPGRG
jgi:hypothetical protein